MIRVNLGENDPKMKEIADGRWFLVCGMVGSGKSKLVSDVLYDRPEFCFALISRLIWLEIELDGRELGNFAIFIII
jgi:hypothetical protein